MLNVCSISTYLSSWGNCTAVLYSVDWDHRRVMGSHHPQLTGARCHVLVLLSKRARSSCVVEEMDHSFANCTVLHCYWLGGSVAGLGR